MQEIVAIVKLLLAFRNQKALFTLSFHLEAVFLGAVYLSPEPTRSSSDIASTGRAASSVSENRRS